MPAISLTKEATGTAKRTWHNPVYNPRQMFYRICLIHPDTYWLKWHMANLLEKLILVSLYDNIIQYP